MKYLLIIRIITIIITNNQDNNDNNRNNDIDINNSNNSNGNNNGNNNMEKQLSLNIWRSGQAAADGDEQGGAGMPRRAFAQRAAGWEEGRPSKNYVAAYLLFRHRF